MLEREGEREATKTRNTQERREYVMRKPSRYRSAKRTECKRSKNTKRKRQGGAKTNPIQQNKKETI